MRSPKIYLYAIVAALQINAMAAPVQHPRHVTYYEQMAKERGTQAQRDEALAYVSRTADDTTAGRQDILALLKAGANPAWQKSEAFYWAISHGNLEILNAFARRKPPLPPHPFEAVNTENKKALVIYRWLLNYGAKPDFYAFDAALSALAGPDKLVQMLLDAGADPNCRGWWNYLNDKSAWGTPLMVAAQKVGAATFTGEEFRDGRLVKILLAHGARVNERAKDGRTALDFAMLDGYGPSSNVRVLLQNGATVKPALAAPILKMATGTNEPLLIDELDKRKLLPSKLSFAALGFPVEIAVVKRLLAHGADPKQTDKYGWTELHQATVDGEVGTMKMLLDAGVDIEARGTGSGIAGTILNGATPLFTADTEKSIESQDNLAQLLLLTHGANPNARDKNGVTPLIFAALGSDRGYGSERAAELLCSHGADVTAKDNEGNTALHYAVLWSLPMVQAILKINSSTDFLEWRSSDGETAFMMALSKGAQVTTETRPDIKDLFPVAQALLKAGAKMDATDNDGNNAFHVNLIDTGALIYLWKLKLDYDLPNLKGYTPLYRACAEGKIEAAEILFRFGANPDFMAKNGLSPRDIASTPYPSDYRALSATEQSNIKAMAKQYKLDPNLIIGSIKPEIDRNRKSIAALFRKPRVALPVF